MDEEYDIDTRAKALLISILDEGVNVVVDGGKAYEAYFPSITSGDWDIKTNIENYQYVVEEFAREFEDIPNVYVFDNVEFNLSRICVQAGRDRDCFVDILGVNNFHHKYPHIEYIEFVPYVGLETLTQNTIVYLNNREDLVATLVDKIEKLQDRLTLIDLSKDNPELLSVEATDIICERCIRDPNALDISGMPCRNIMHLCDRQLAQGF